MSGFTLIELLVVVIIVGILVGFAMPSFRLYVASQAIRMQVSDLVGSLRLARTESIKRGRAIVLCRTADPNALAPRCADGGDWSSGWMLADGDQVIRVQQAYPNSGGIEPDGISAIRFLPNGLALGTGGSFLFRPKLDKSDGAYKRLTRQICIAASGVSRPC